MKLSETLQECFDEGFLLKPRIETIEQVKELEEKAEAFDLLSENNSVINHSFISGNTHMAIDLEDGQKELLVEGKDLLECVRKARGEGKPVVNKKLTTERARGEE